MDLGLLVMAIIIGITIAVIASVMFYGLKHDPHMDVRSPESSRSVQILQTQNAAAMKKLAEMQMATVSATEVTTDATASGGSALGSDEEKAARKAAALARKAAKQQVTE